METVKLLVGSIEALGNGSAQDMRRPVEFEGQELGKLTVYGYDQKRGRLTDTRGTTQTLYQTADGGLVVHVETWSRWAGEPNVSRVEAITEDDLRVGGAYDDLGHECGFGRALTLEEALAHYGALIRLLPDGTPAE